MQVVDSEGYLKVKLVGGPAGPFVPYTGATANVDLGEYEIKVGQLELDQTPTGTAGVAVMRWNDADGTADLGLKGGNVTLQIGQEQVTRVVNKTGVNLLEANYQAVRVDGAQGNRLKVALAQANNDANSADTLGLVTETINDNQEGFVTVSGLVRNINTTGSIQTETWLDGDVLYLSGTVAGQITNIKPAAPIHTVIMGYVVRAHATQGQIYVKVDNGYELDELHNVAITTPLNNQVLQYEAVTQLWKNKTIATGITIGTTAITSGTVGRVLFEGTGNVVQESANLFWDNTNGRLGIGGTPSTFNLDVVGTARVQSKLTVGTSTVSPYNFNVWGGAFESYISLNNTNSGTGSADGFQIGLEPNGVDVFFLNRENGFIQFRTADTNRMRIANTGNVLINTTTDAGFKLDVNGTARVKSTGNTSATTGFTVQNSSSTSWLSVRDDGRIQIGTTGAQTFVQGATTFQAQTAADNMVVFQGGLTTGTFFRTYLSGTDYPLEANANGLTIRSSGNTAQNSSSILDVQSTTKGFLPPRMTTTQKNAIASPATGLLVFDSTLNKLCVRGASAWETITSL